MASQKVAFPYHRVSVRDETAHRLQPLFLSIVGSSRACLGKRHLNHRTAFGCAGIRERKPKTKGVAHLLLHELSEKARTGECGAGGDVEGGEVGGGGAGRLVWLNTMLNQPCFNGFQLLVCWNQYHVCDVDLMRRRQQQQQQRRQLEVG